eukprot:CAMPEP_0119308012 /NCGR_PEP_ID=MMETSP1333-20130426/8350_1 /TAXON_ID=418940 /ORGANISM="Scyphosphaera apsteinii, Strain RCC1455" /LENGTH=181 /DNA_ID=CAMNT_0007311693 /DNA_START=116 /DNA_END=661 /DNA_ORIENTATION=+
MALGLVTAAVLMMARSWQFGSSSFIEGAAGLLGALVGKQAFRSGMEVKFEPQAFQIRHALFSSPVAILACFACVWPSMVRLCTEVNRVGRALDVGARWRALPLDRLPHLCKLFVFGRLIYVGVVGAHRTDSGLRAGIVSRFGFDTLKLYARVVFEWLEAAPTMGRPIAQFSQLLIRMWFFT